MNTRSWQLECDDFFAEHSHRISEKVRVIANAVLGGLHHNYELAPC